MRWTIRDLFYVLTITAMAIAWTLDARQNYGSPTVGKVCEECGSDGNAHTLRCPVIARLILHSEN